MKIKFYIYFIFFGLILSTCKKYPEDKFISIGTSKNRLDGEWQLNKIEINGDDVGYKYNDSLSPLRHTDYKFWFRFDRNLDKNSKETYDLFMINKSSKKVTPAIEEADVGGVSFGLNVDKDKSLRVGSSFSKIPIKDSVSFKILTKLFSDFSWDVRMLHHKKLIIEKTRNNNTYRLYLNKTRTH